MKCLTPIEVRTRKKSSSKVVPFFKSEPLFVLAPCGHCYACQTNRRNEWDLRLRVESMNSTESFFITLTYSDEFYPENFHSWKKDIQDFVHSLRKKYSFRYYAVGEYGEKLGRKHSHLLFFLKSDNVDIYHYFYKYWTKGFIDIGDVTDSSIHYVTKWHINPKFQEGKEQHGFTLMSKGVGSDFLDSLSIDNICSTHSINGKRLPVSRYFRKKIGFVSPDPMSLEDYVRKRYNLETHEQVVDKVNSLKKSYELRQKTPRKSLF